LATVLVLGSATYELVAIHPYELSYYNTLIGGPRGAWNRGMELSYWYDAFTPRTIARLNTLFPHDAHVGFPNDLSAPSTFSELQSLGELRGDLKLDSLGDDYPYLWLLTHDSKATANSRLLFVLAPWYAEWPRQLDGLRVLTVTSPRAAARAVALWLLCDAADTSPPEPPRAPEWARRFPLVARLWGDGLDRVHRLALNEPIFAWATSDPDGLRAAAQALTSWARSSDKLTVQTRAQQVLKWLDSSGGMLPQATPPEFAGIAPFDNHPRAFELLCSLVRYDRRTPFASDLLKRRPDALLDAIEILCRRADAVRRVMTRYGYTDPDSIGGYLDRDLAHD
jgi:hypothetical protein